MAHRVHGSGLQRKRPTCGAASIGWRSGNRLKILTWDRDGYVLWYKRLEIGVFKLPRVAPGAGSVELRASELAMLLDGIDMAKLKRVPRYERPAQSAVKRAETVVA